MCSTRVLFVYIDKSVIEIHVRQGLSSFKLQSDTTDKWIITEFGFEATSPLEVIRIISLLWTMPLMNKNKKIYIHFFSFFKFNNIAVIIYVVLSVKCPVWVIEPQWLRLCCWVNCTTSGRQEGACFQSSLLRQKERVQQHPTNTNNEIILSHCEWKSSWAGKWAGREAHNTWALEHGLHFAVPNLNRINIHTRPKKANKHFSEKCLAGTN